MKRLALLALLGFAACADSDVVSIRIQLAANGSGTVGLTALRPAPEPGPAERAASGAAWEERATLHASKGRFEKLGGLRVADIQFTLSETADGIPIVRATLPCGPSAQWPKILAPSVEEQRKLSLTLDASGKTTTAGQVLKLELLVPGLVTGVGIAPEPRGFSTEKYRDRATLFVPIKQALAEGDGKQILFDVSWRKP